MVIERFRAEHAPPTAAMCDSEGWDSWRDVAAVERALSAPGVATFVAVEGDEVVGAARVLSDGEINWVLGTLIVARGKRAGASARSSSRPRSPTPARGASTFWPRATARVSIRALAGRELSGFRVSADAS